MAYKNYLLVVTDIGEECDDETAIFYLYKQTQKNPELFIEVLCVGGKCSENERIQSLHQHLKIQETSNFKVGKMSEMPKYTHICPTKTLLQIGPSTQDPTPYQKLLNDYTYILLGKLGTTNSSKGKPYNFASHMADYAQHAIILDTKVHGETRIPLFSMNSSNFFPYKVKKEIIRMGFKNTLGRAPPSLIFLNQLVAPGGANYNTANSIYDTVYSVGDFENITITEEALNSALHFNLHLTKTQTEGLARMLISFNHLFDLPVSQIFESSNDIFTEEILWNEDHELTTAFRKYQELLFEYPNMGLTPAYDLVASWVALMNKDDFYHYFESTIENIWYLKQSTFPDINLICEKII
jgi:hypothetical protein